MFLELFMEVFYIKIKVRSILKKINDNTEEIIDTLGIKNKNNITFINDFIKYKIINDNGKLKLIRETKEFIHSFNFILNKKTKSEYFIKEYKATIEVEILTTNIFINNNKIEIGYKIIDSNEDFNYIIEMSDY